MAAQGLPNPLTFQPPARSKREQMISRLASHWPNHNDKAASNCSEGWEIKSILDDQRMFRSLGTKEEQCREIPDISAMELRLTATRMVHRNSNESSGACTQGMSYLPTLQSQAIGRDGRSEVHQSLQLTLSRCIDSRERRCLR